MSIAVKPYTAFVTCPEEVTSVSGSAKNARNASECPSSSKIFRLSLRGETGADFAEVLEVLAAIISDCIGCSGGRQTHRRRNARLAGYF
ncbi:MAG TPA: hypothetical protein VGH50_14690 [Candidatus Binatia bacterium]